MNNEQIRAAALEEAARITDRMVSETDLTYKAGILRSVGSAIRSLATTSTEPAARTALPARRFASVSGFVDADYVEFPEGEANGGGVLNGVPHKDLHYTRAEAEECVRNGVWREVPIEASASPVPRAQGGITCDLTDYSTPTSYSNGVAASPAAAVAAPTDISTRLRERATGGYTAVRTEDGALMLAAATEIEHYYGGMLAWKQTAQKKDRDWQEEVTKACDARCAARAAAPVAGSQHVPAGLTPAEDAELWALLKAYRADDDTGADVIGHNILKRINTILRAAPAVPVPADQAWQPMETAPKDGREVLLQVAFRAGIPGKQLVGHFMEGGHCIEDHPAIARGWYFWNGCFFDEAAKPTHWMPLPAAPSLQQPKTGSQP